MTLNEVWHSRNEAPWRVALDEYWRRVDATSIRELEHEIDRLDANAIQQLDPAGWYDFLLSKYFLWKYRPGRRYGSTTKHLKNYAASNSLDELHRIKEAIFAANPSDVEGCLMTAMRIRGLGTAGASGLLSILFPAHFATADQFVVKALRQIEGLPQAAVLLRMNPEVLTPKDGVLLIEVMRAKAAENNRSFNTDYWTPRRIDMVLWTLGH